MRPTEDMGSVPYRDTLLTRNHVSVVFSLRCINFKHLGLREPLQEDHYAGSIGSVAYKFFFLQTENQLITNQE